MKLIELSGKSGSGFFVKVDNKDYLRLIKHKWYLKTSRYAYALINSKWVPMHRFILGVLDKSIVVDHINHDGLDNQRSNLRTATRSQNAMNRERAFGVSKYIGVSFHVASNKWVSAIYVNKKRLCLGYFNNEIEAAYIRDEAAKKHYGEFAKLNHVMFIKEPEKPANTENKIDDSSVTEEMFEHLDYYK